MKSLFTFVYPMRSLVPLINLVEPYSADVATLRHCILHVLLFLFFIMHRLFLFVVDINLRLHGLYGTRIECIEDAGI